MDKLLSKYEFQSDQIFELIPKKHEYLVNSVLEPVQFKKGKMLFYEGGIPTGVLILFKGKAKIYKMGSDGKEQIFYIYRAGDLIGYHALLCDERYEDSCETLEELEAYFISLDNFLALMEKIPTLRKLLLRNMSHEFGVLVNTITILAQKSLRVRLALYLLILNRRYNMAPAQDKGINLSRTDLANIIGTARESLGKLIKEFREEGLITVSKRIIYVNSPKELYEIVTSNYC
jgi:CRP-like cAMP-binding protein